MLELSDVRAAYGKIAILHGIGLTVQPGKVTSILGSNGAGKTTTLRVITGLLPATGTVRFEGRSLLSLRPDQILRLGIAMVPEKRELFVDMSVEENLRLGAYSRSDAGEIRRDLDHVLGLFPVLRERYRQTAATLSGGEQQMLTIARALMCRPRLLLLDEPSLGLAPKLVDEIFDTIDDIRRTGISILLVEQNARAALAVSDFGYVMDIGEIRASGPADELEADPWIRDAYLGN